MTDTIERHPLDNWRDRLAGRDTSRHDNKKINHEGHPDPGFYRRKTKDQTTNRVWWTPAALWLEQDKLVGVIGDRDMTELDLTDLWTHLVGNPIPEDMFFKFEGRINVPDEEWPRGLINEPKRPPFGTSRIDSPVVKQAQRDANELARARLDNIPAVNREVVRTDNAAPEVDPVEAHRTGINNAIAAAPKVVPKTAEECALAEGSKNRIAELRLAADKAGKAKYEPLYRAYTAEQKLWSPMVAAAQTAEKALATLVLTFKENERKRIAKEQAEAAAKQAAIDEANARAADRAIATGKPEQAPVVVEAPAPAAPVAVAPTYGKRTTKAEVKILLDAITDQQAVYDFFKDDGEVKALLFDLAAAAVKAGRAVPGTKTREGLI